MTAGYVCNFLFSRAYDKLAGSPWALSLCTKLVVLHGRIEAKKPQLKSVPPHLKTYAEQQEESEGPKAAKEAPPTRQTDEEEGRETKAAANKKTANEQWEENKKRR